MNTNKKNNKERISFPSELKKICSRVHTLEQLWLMDDLLVQIVSFLPEEQDRHAKWQKISVFISRIEWIMKFKPRYQYDLFTEKERICLKYLLLERLSRFVYSTGRPLFREWSAEIDSQIIYVDIQELKAWALQQQKHLPAWLAWLADLWHNEGDDCWVYDDFDWVELDPRPLVKRIREKRGADWCKVYDQNCPDEYRI